MTITAFAAPSFWGASRPNRPSLVDHRVGSTTASGVASLLCLREYEK